MNEWQHRGVSFHSWRHFFAANMADVVDRRAMIATGHRIAAVFDTYADHATATKFREVASAAQLVFSDLFVA
jgi:integrase